MEATPFLAYLRSTTSGNISLGRVEHLTSGDFAPDVIKAVARKGEIKQRYRQHFSNTTLATL